jgi:hypothetical protein
MEYSGCETAANRAGAACQGRVTGVVDGEIHASKSKGPAGWRSLSERLKKVLADDALAAQETRNANQTRSQQTQRAGLRN